MPYDMDDIDLRHELVDVILLMLQSDLHRNFFIKDLERLVIPPLMNGKMSVIYSTDYTGMSATYTPRGLYSYAFLDEKAEAGYMDGSRKLQPEDWENGPKDGTLWIIDFIAPFNNARELVRQVQQELTDYYIDTYPKDDAWFRRHHTKGDHKRWSSGVLFQIEERKKKNAHLRLVS